jgi:hypothetical protein
LGEQEVIKGVFNYFLLPLLVRSSTFQKQRSTIYGSQKQKEKQKKAGDPDIIGISSDRSALENIRQQITSFLI